MSMKVNVKDVMHFLSQLRSIRIYCDLSREHIICILKSLWIIPILN